MLIPLLPFLLWGLAYAVTKDRLRGLLPARASQPLEDWQRQGILVRGAAEWEALYLSNGLRLGRIAGLLCIGLAAATAVLSTVTFLDLCHATGILDGTFLELEPALNWSRFGNQRMSKPAGGPGHGLRAWVPPCSCFLSSPTFTNNGANRQAERHPSRSPGDARERIRCELSWQNPPEPCGALRQWAPMHAPASDGPAARATGL